MVPQSWCVSWDTEGTLWLTVPSSQAPNKALASVLGKSNLCFAGMSISVNISVDGLNLSVPATRQVGAAALCPQPYLCPTYKPATSTMSTLPPPL